MDATTLWPFFFEVNLIQRTSFRERTMMVTIEEHGMSHWIDHSARFGHAGGFGGFTFKDGEIQHFRGDRTISPNEAEREAQEFTVDVELETLEFVPVQSLIASIGKPWLAGWDPASSKRLHDLLTTIYWKHVNQYVQDPFDERDA